MKTQETATVTLKSGTVGLGRAPSTMAVAGRLLGLNAGDWSMIMLGLVLSGLLMALG